MRADEDATLAASIGHKTEHIGPQIAAHDARIANTAGDSLNCLVDLEGAVPLDVETTPSRSFKEVDAAR